MSLLFAAFLVFLSILLRTALATRIETFSDGDCQNKLNSWNGPNGYPSGRCTSTLRKGNFTSFKVVDPDPGCAITIYGKDTTADICSGFQKVVSPSTCFNTTWRYYSIDVCFKAGGSSLTDSSSTSGTATESSSSASHTTKTGGGGGRTHTHKSSTLSTQASTTTSGPATSAASSSDNGPNGGAIAGGTVGGVVFGIAVAAAGIFFFIRSRRSKRNQGPPAYQSSDQAVEIAAKEVQPPGPPPQELEQHSIMELQGRTLHEMPGGDEARGELAPKSPTATGGSGSPILWTSREGKE